MGERRREGYGGEGDRERGEGGDGGEGRGRWWGREVRGEGEVC